MRRLMMIACLAAAGCGLLDPEPVVDREFEVAAWLAGCTGVGDRYCLLVRTPGEEAYRLMYDAPAGFDYEWGREYVIRVEERENPRPRIDGSSMLRALTRVISSEPVAPGTTFELNVPSEFIVSSGTARVELAGQSVRVECGSECGDLVATTATSPRVLLKLGFIEGGVGPITLLGWQRCETQSPSTSACAD